MIRLALPSDAVAIAWHRAEMFREMGVLQDPLFDPLVAATTEQLPELIASGTYMGWLVEGEGPGGVVAGVGLYVRPILPRPLATGADASELIDREGIVLNAYTQPAHRRRGLARALMTRLLVWTEAHDIRRVVLHASAQGRPLYEQLGFTMGNEMRFLGLREPDKA
ncbi:MAG: GNAT family N-acetyltransferase [Longimicrobiales bacterium]|nr:GNAT family N-acetyltransferase [Longimicrobiales bacterium]